MPSTVTPSPVSRRRRRVAEPESEDEKAPRSSQGETSFSETTRDGSKRARVEKRVDSESSSDSGANWPSSDDAQSPTHKTPERERPLSSVPIRSADAPGTNEGNNARRARNRTNSATPAQRSSSARDPEVFRAGAIVRVKLKDFVTYTSAEFFPGPRLNMVIGPNGTGKSTLVCAICLGLGWGPQYLGRAKDPGEFVKNGHDEATIEIELAGGERFRQNSVISRTIKRNGNKSIFAIDGRQTTKKEVRELAGSFSIQIDNLCQFLPQDKVSEFAALSPVELLHSTQRAAAGTELVALHENLKTLRAEQKRILASTSGEREHLAGLANRQEMQREDVERMKQRAEIKKKIEFLQMARPLPLYQESFAEYTSLKERNRTLTRERDELQSKLEPALRTVNEKKEYQSRLEKVVKQKRLILTRMDESAKKISDEMLSADQKSKDLSNRVEAEKKSVASDVDAYKKLQQRIARIKQQIDAGAPDFDPDEYAERIRRCTRKSREVEGQVNDVQSRKREIVRNLMPKKNKLAESEARLRNLASQSGQQEEKLRSISWETSKAWKWVKEHQDKFDKPVYGPPVVECSVTDPKYADALESLMQRNDFLAFTTQSRADFRTLQKVLLTEMGLHDVTIKTCSNALSEFRPPVPDEERRSLGFDGWAKDFLKGPEPVLAMLCSENRMHQTPFTLRDISDDEYRNMEKSSISSWVSGRQSYQVMRRREYGPNATSTRVRQLRNARMWTNQQADPEVARRLEADIDAGKRELESIQTSLKEEDATIAQLEEESNNATREKAELENEKSTKQTALTNYNALPAKLTQQEEKLKAAHDRTQSIRQRIDELRNQQDEVHLEKASTAIKYAVAVEKMRHMHEDFIRTEVKNLEAVSDFETLKERNSEVNRTLEEKISEVQQSARLLKEASKNSKKARDKIQEVFNSSDNHPGLKEVLDQVTQYTVAQLEADIDSEKARLELTGEGSSRIIQEFEDRQRSIDKLKKQLSNSQQKLGDLDRGIAEVRTQWEPRLDAIVQKLSDAFSESFQRIGCAGQVSVDKLNEPTNDTDGAGDGTGSASSDFDQWSIKIEVKFRDHESLQVLNSHRQSGGERAVSTIFYLMALQSLSASPFRVVDEINQGMDPHNERTVHGRMVDIACGHADSQDTGGQYFLITPKLLSGLSYRRGMKVLCIASGEYMPEDYDQLDFKKSVLRMKDAQEKARRAASAKGKERMVGRGRDVGVGA